MFCILWGSVLAALLVPLAARAWLPSPRPAEAPMMAVSWGPTQQVSQNVYTDSMQFYPALAVVSPTVCVAWSMQVGDGQEYYDPYYISSSQNGEVGQWGGRFNIQSNSTETTRMDVAVDSGQKLHFVWSEYTKTPVSYTLYYSYTSAISIQTITQSFLLSTPSIATSSSQVHVAWAQKINETTNSIQHAYKTIGGGAWSSTSLTSTISMVVQPAVAVTSAGTAHVVWSEGNGKAVVSETAKIFYKNSSNWSTTLRNVSGDTEEDGRSPAIALSGNNVYVVWCEFISKNEQYIRFRRSVNGGSTWDPSVRVSGRFAANEDSPTWLRPAIAIDSEGNIHLAFNGAGTVSDPEDIYYAYKPQGGNWQCCRNITSHIPGNNTTPAIAASGEYVHLVWTGPPDIFDPDGNKYEVLYERAIPLKGSLYLPVVLKSYR